MNSLIVLLIVLMKDEASKRLRLFPNKSDKSLTELEPKNSAAELFTKPTILFIIEYLHTMLAIDANIAMNRKNNPDTLNFSECSIVE
ncbi:hypothetical protein [Inconstantimicrobium porci]|uniref:Uncharacterized protein n=1 Tax=Inconstantimicrobium porci TaxID=2652291 RepID=A0A7X2N0I4_9CLOT|nr:hypothetical protein [Inconstantimicrobium porci]MSR92453.1 hypothetical protein [Inconstantimicrobium porci]